MRPVRRPKADEGPRIVDDDPTIADRYKRCAAAIAEKRSEDQLSSAASKNFIRDIHARENSAEKVEAIKFGQDNERR